MINERQAIVDLFDQVLASRTPIEIDPDVDHSCARIANQLIKENYLDGEVAINEKELPAMIAILDVTIKGRLLREELIDRIHDSRFSTKMRKGVLFLLSALCGLGGGILGAVITAIILRKLAL